MCTPEKPVAKSEPVYTRITASCEMHFSLNEPLIISFNINCALESQFLFDPRFTNTQLSLKWEHLMIQDCD